MRSLLIFSIAFFHCLALTAQGSERPFTKGVYGDPGAFLKNGMTFKSLGINAIFVRSASLNGDIYKTAKGENVRVYVEFPTLNGKDYLVDHPEAWPINEKGERAPAADWFMGICLTDPGFRSHREQELRNLLKDYAVDGIWLDYLHWHAQFETPNPILPETCFCDRCILQFEKEMSVDVPPGDTGAKAKWILSASDSSWRRWRSRVLNDWVSDMKAIVKERRPGAILGIYYCPWYPDDFDGAHYRILGLDMKELARIADVFSPMLYHQMMDRPPDWVAEYVNRLDEAGITNGTKPLIWPIVQAHSKPGIITTEEFRQVMWNGSRAPSSGIMMFTLHSMISEPGKLEVMKDLFRKK
ncbi:MAG: hypothetical protein WD824_08280 [Cyclobacteriaceae bacterium]